MIVPYRSLKDFLAELEKFGNDDQTWMKRYLQSSGTREMIDSYRKRVDDLRVNAIVCVFVILIHHDK